MDDKKQQETPQTQEPADTLDETAVHEKTSEQTSAPEFALPEEGADKLEVQQHKTPTSIHKNHEKQPPYVIIIALLIMALLVGVGIVAYLRSENTNSGTQQETTEQNQINSDADSQINNQPATESDVQKEVDNIDSVINDLDELGDPENIDDESLGL